jgi:hypothetical protein
MRSNLAVDCVRPIAAQHGIDCTPPPVRRHWAATALKAMRDQSRSGSPETVCRAVPRDLAWDAERGRKFLVSEWKSATNLVLRISVRTLLM